MRFLKCSLICLASLCSINAGFLEYDDTNGNAYRWNTTTGVRIAVDSGDVSGSVTNAQALVVITDVINAYNAGVTGNTLTIISEGSTAVDIVGGPGGNVDTFVNDVDASVLQVTPNDCKIASQVAGSNLVIFFDEDGAYFSAKNYPSGVLGVATPTVHNSSDEIVCAYVIINGAEVNSLDQFEYILAHELGHALNLSHSQVNGDIIDVDTGKTPLMYPAIPANPTAALSPLLKLDDQYAYSYLYAQNQIASTGSIQGRIKNRFDESVQGVYVTCSDPSAVENSVAWVSDSELDGDGEYVCGLLPAGDYEVEIEPIVVAINSWPENPPFIPAEFYSGADEGFEAALDDLSSKESVTVATSEVPNIDIVLNENGRLSNGVTVSGTVGPGIATMQGIAPQINELEYFFYVPGNADRVTFSLEAADVSQDIDLLARCGSPYSLATSTVGPLFEQIDPTGDQSDAVGVTTSGSETIELSGASSPGIQACQYHLVIPNYTTSSVPFEITATIEGSRPSVVFDFDARDSVQTNGETLVAQATAEGQGDRFIIDGLTLTDAGEVGVTGVTSFQLYEDLNDNGLVDASDTLIGQTSSVSGNVFTFADIQIYLLEDESRKLLVTYTKPVSASMPWSMWALFLGAGLGLIFRKQRVASCMIVALCLSVQLSCSSPGDSGNYQVEVAQKSDISGSALGFGDDFTLKTDAVETVQDFFSN